jgi:hypothetical protein
MTSIDLPEINAALPLEHIQRYALIHGILGTGHLKGDLQRSDGNFQLMLLAAA